MKIPKKLLYTDNLFHAFYGYPCFDCKVKDGFNEYKFVIGFSDNPPKGSIRAQFLKDMFAVVYRCPLCGRIFWLHCEGIFIKKFQNWKKSSVRKVCT